MLQALSQDPPQDLVRSFSLFFLFLQWVEMLYGFSLGVG
jgi:hypothetical protein